MLAINPFNLWTKLLTEATFTDPINAAQLREHFAFSASIRVYEDGSIKDSLNRVDISQESPPLVFSFE